MALLLRVAYTETHRDNRDRTARLSESYTFTVTALEQEWQEPIAGRAELERLADDDDRLWELVCEVDRGEWDVALDSEKFSGSYDFTTAHPDEMDVGFEIVEVPDQEAEALRPRGD